jgi:SAM-dependent methyltransferase
MERQLFDSINQHILNELEITNTDTLVELCCGNGLCTYEFAQKANNVIAVDFSPHLIADAIRLKSASNICYIQKDVVDFVKTYIPDVPLRTVKCLMNDSLAYFVPDQLKEIVYALNANSGGNFIFLIRGIPNDELKWNYYNTKERQLRYKQLVEEGDITNDGLGRWWKKSEIHNICNELELKCEIQNQANYITNYRMDVKITSKTNSNLNANS